MRRRLIPQEPAAPPQRVAIHVRFRTVDYSDSSIVPISPTVHGRRFMSKSKKFRPPILTFAFSIGVAFMFEASVVSAHVRMSDSVPEVGQVLSMAQHDDPGALESSAQAQTRTPQTSTFELAGNDKERRESNRRAGPPPIEVKGHEQPIRVIRRTATPIPRVSNSTRRSRYRSGRSGYYSGHSYYRGHRHHSDCGHDYYWDYGDRYESRTLGRSCIYGPKGEVIYEPADLICAPGEGAAPAAEASPPAAPDPSQATPAASQATR
jgi:hypothetical protein